MSRRASALSPQPILDYYAHDGGAPAGLAFQFFLTHGTASVSRYPYRGQPTTFRKVPDRAFAEI